MNNSKNMNQLPVFRIDSGELYAYVKDNCKIQWNTLSPFANQPAVTAPVSADTLALGKDEEFNQMIQVIAQPDLKLQFNQAGPGVPLVYSSALIKKTSNGNEVVILQNDNERLFIIYFKEFKAFTTYFSNQYASIVVPTGMNVIGEQVPLETLLCILNLADMYKRGYYLDMLQYNTTSIDGIYEDEYLTVLEKSLISGDLRWLVPSFLRLIPDLKDVKLEFTGEHLEIAQRLQFLNCVADNERRIFTLHSSAKYLGLEFIHFWKYSIGMTLSNTEGILGQVYLAVTDEINHWITLIPTNKGLDITHETLDFDQVGEYIGAFVTTKHISKNETVSNATVTKKFCASCGAKLATQGGFCPSCGTKIE